MRALRRALGLSQARLAEQLGMSKRQIQYYEAGRDIPKVVELACDHVRFMYLPTTIKAMSPEDAKRFREGEWT